MNYRQTIYEQRWIQLSYNHILAYSASGKTNIFGRNILLPKLSLTFLYKQRNFVQNSHWDIFTIVLNLFTALDLSLQLWICSKAFNTWNLDNVFRIGFLIGYWLAFTHQHPNQVPFICTQRWDCVSHHFRQRLTSEQSVVGLNFERASVRRNLLIQVLNRMLINSINSWKLPWKCKYNDYSKKFASY